MATATIAVVAAGEENENNVKNACVWENRNAKTQEMKMFFNLLFFLQTITS